MADESKFEQVKGNVKETAGNVMDNKDLEQEGKEDKASGKAKEVTENAKDKVNDFIDKLKIILCLHLFVSIVYRQSDYLCRYFWINILQRTR